MEEKKEVGKRGMSGIIGHLDYQGYKRTIDNNDSYPTWLNAIIKFRNENLRKEWLKSMEHEVKLDWEGEGEMPTELHAEFQKKVYAMGNRVQARFNELERIYDELDKGIDEAIKINTNNENKLL